MTEAYVSCNCHDNRPDMATVVEDGTVEAIGRAEEIEDGKVRSRYRRGRRRRPTSAEPLRSRIGLGYLT